MIFFHKCARARDASSQRDFGDHCEIWNEKLFLIKYGWELAENQLQSRFKILSVLEISQLSWRSTQCSDNLNLKNNRIEGFDKEKE